MKATAMKLMLCVTAALGLGAMMMMMMMMLPVHTFQIPRLAHRSSDDGSVFSAQSGAGAIDPSAAGLVRLFSTPDNDSDSDSDNFDEAGTIDPGAAGLAQSGNVNVNVNVNINENSNGNVYLDEGKVREYITKIVTNDPTSFPEGDDLIEALMDTYTSLKARNKPLSEFVFSAVAQIALKMGLTTENENLIRTLQYYFDVELLISQLADQDETSKVRERIAGIVSESNVDAASQDKLILDLMRAYAKVVTNDTPLTAFTGAAIATTDRLSDPEMKTVIRGIQEYFDEKQISDFRFSISDSMFEVEETVRSNSFDVNRFSKRISGLFQWRMDAKLRQDYQSPYLPIVQSSGTGKTKLMYDFCKASEKLDIGGVSKLMISCLEEDKVESANRDKYDFYIDLKRTRNRENDRDNITTQLGQFLARSTEENVVLCFDEAQNLLTGDQLPLRVIRRFLRREVFQQATATDGTVVQITNVVAVLAGTSQSLTLLYPDSKFESTFSREPTQEYVGDDEGKIFPPFLELLTMGSLRGRIKYKPDATEYDVSIQYGRPLFARLIAPGPHNDPKTITKATSPLDDGQHVSILSRIMLGRRDPLWKEDQRSCLSVLSTRVQLGSISTPVVSDLVSKGYANLVYFRAATNSSEVTSSHFCHMADPVCARLAMAMMIEGNKVEGTTKKGDQMTYSGKSPNFWFQKIYQVVTAGLYSPSRGELGEIVSALYMLACGDKLRQMIDPTLSTFSIPLEDLIASMEQSEESFKDVGDSSPVSERALISSSNSSPKLPSVSFIQVVRNELRVPYDKDYMTNQNLLRRLYESGRLSYTYEGCGALDMFGSAKVRDGQLAGADQFVPILFSVKCRQGFNPGAQKRAIADMIKCIGVDTPAICLLLLVDNDAGLYNATAEVDEDEGKEKLDHAAQKYKDASEALKEANKAVDDAKNSLREVNEEGEASDKEVKALDKKVTEAKAFAAKKLTVKKEAGAVYFSELAQQALLQDMSNASATTVARIISMPANDQFGASNLLSISTRVGSELAEVVASHDELHDIDGLGSKSRSFLRAKPIPLDGDSSPLGDPYDYLVEYYKETAGDGTV